MKNPVAVVNEALKASPTISDLRETLEEILDNLGNGRLHSQLTIDKIGAEEVARIRRKIIARFSSETGVVRQLRSLKDRLEER